MEASFEDAFKVVKDLVSDFDKGKNYFFSAEYQEEAVRRDFIDKFFIALGWDVNHDYQKNPYEQEVKTEKTVKVRRARKKADYAFFVHPNYRDPVFYVEAKKPSRDLYNRDDYFQTIMYGYNSQTPIAILTDFEELHVVDTRYKTTIETALSRRVKQYHYSDYLKEDVFAEIYFLFSRESVSKNSIHQYAENLPTPRGKAYQKKLFPGGFKSIDESILDELDEIRLDLAKAIKKHHPELGSYELTDAAQIIINRLIFIRFLEDKLIESEYYISEFGENNSAWNDFVDLSSRLDAKYNGVVFKKHFIDSPNFLPFSDPTFGEVCSNLSHLNSDFYFDVIPVHILGSIYERFLGKIVKATDKRATIEEKPEVKRAGGVFYTPQYVVRYIVNKTIGEYIDDKSPNQIRKYKFADIACGSGSFLITVFETILDYYSKWYNYNPEKAKKDGCIYIEKQWVLSLKLKQDILLNNIFGVDLDAQAVDVTKLSLYLKLLEDQTTATTNDMMVLFKEKILPPLENNIKCGNSLIENDLILFNSELGFSDEELIRNIKPFGWKSSFREVFENGGFDVIVGNPPYDVLEKERKMEFKPHFALRNYIKYTNEYKPAIQGKLNLFRFFIVKAYNLTKNKGKVGLIVPLSLIADKTSSNCRKFILKNSKDLQADCFPQKDDRKKRIFKDAKQSTVVITSTKTASNNKPKIIVNTFPYNKFEDEKKSCAISLKEMESLDSETLPIPLVNNNELNVLKKLIKNPKVVPFKEISQEIVINRGEINQTTYRDYINSNGLNARLVKGVEIGSYRQNKHLSQGEREWFDENEYLRNHNPRRVAEMRRIATQRITGVDERLRVVATIIEPKAYLADSTNSIYLTPESNYSLEYLLALLNSSLFQWRFKLTSTNNNVATNQIASLPFRLIDFDDGEDFNKHEIIRTYVEKLISINLKREQSENNAERITMGNLIADLEYKIDELVLELFDLTTDDLK